MKYKVVTIFFLLFVVACSKNDETMLLKHHINDVKYEDFRDALTKSSIANEDKAFIIRDIDFDEPTYDLISINIGYVSVKGCLNLRTHNINDSAVKE